MSEFSTLEVVVAIITIVSATLNVILYVVKKQQTKLYSEKSMLYVSDLDNIYSTCYRAIQDLDLCTSTLENLENNNDITNGLRKAEGAKSAINAVRSLCQHRTLQIINRQPTLIKPSAHV